MDQKYEESKERDTNEMDIGEQIRKELEEEEEIPEEARTSTNINNTQNFMDNLGISINQECFKTLKCGKQKMKRGRKSLKELISAAGQAKE